MKQLERPARGLGLVIATGVVVVLGCSAYAWMNRTTAPDAASGAAPTPITAQVASPADTATATTAPSAGTSPTAGAQLPATLPPGITLVSTVPNAQPPQATLLVDGRLQAQPLGSSVAGVGLKVREVTAEGITLGQSEGPPLYTLRINSAAETTRLMAEARAQRLAERQPTLVKPSGDPVVQRDADHAAALPDEMKVTVHRRQPVTTGAVGSL
jgi:hypothetical protein